MLVFLIGLYVLEANGLIVPTACFVVVWILSAIKFALGIFIGINKK